MMAKRQSSAYAVSRDLKNFEKGVISPQIKWDKTADMFRQENSKIAILCLKRFTKNSPAQMCY